MAKFKKQIIQAVEVLKTEIEDISNSSKTKIYLTADMNNYAERSSIEEITIYEKYWNNDMCLFN